MRLRDLLLVLACTAIFSVFGFRVIAADGPTAESPKLSVGDEWRFTGNAVFRVEAVEGDFVITTAEFPGNRCVGCRQYRDKNLMIVKMVDKTGAPAHDPNAGLKLLDFPLTVGKSWEANVNLFSPSANRSFPYDNSFKVESYGDVKTKAGVFKAFAISWRQVSTGAGNSWDGRATLWYSPEVKWFIKREVHTSRWFSDAELESYSLK